jgi:hypothetical protein
MLSQILLSLFRFTMFSVFWINKKIRNWATIMIIKSLAAGKLGINKFRI